MLLKITSHVWFATNSLPISFVTHLWSHQASLRKQQNLHFCRKNTCWPVLFQRLFMFLVLTLSSTIELFRLNYSTNNNPIWLENKCIKNLVTNTIIPSNARTLRYSFMINSGGKICPGLYLIWGISGILIHILKTFNSSVENILLRNKKVTANNKFLIS